MAVSKKQGQTIADIALINFGYLEAMADVATLNNLSLTDEFQSVELPVISLANDKLKIVKFFTDRIVLPPATNLNFDFATGIEFWGIEFDFIVS